jgi:NDP-sugar pyrophosphorylase family protein
VSEQTSNGQSGENTVYDMVTAMARRQSNEGPLRAIVLAGGRGTRLEPFTSVLPKPLMPIGGRAILEVVVEQLAASGITNVTFCVGYLSHLIRAVFANGERTGAEIDYVQETEPLGTAGPLRLIDGLDQRFIVMNGDVLTTLDYNDLVRRHVESGNLLTVATHERTIKIDYGVLRQSEAEDNRVVAYEEKPEFPLQVSMGIYVMEPEALNWIPEGRRFDFPDLVQDLLAAGEQVGAYNYNGLWFDIGRQEDYELAVAAWEHTDDVAHQRYPVHVAPADEAQAGPTTVTTPFEDRPSRSYESRT